MPLKKRKAVDHTARWEMFVRLRDDSGWTFKQIGDEYGGISPQAAQKVYLKGKALASSRGRRRSK